MEKYNSPKKTIYAEFNITNDIKVKIFKLHKSRWLTVNQTSRFENEDQLFLKNCMIL